MHEQPELKHLTEAQEFDAPGFFQTSSGPLHSSETQEHGLEKILTLLQNSNKAI